MTFKVGDLVKFKDPSKWVDDKRFKLQYLSEVGRWEFCHDASNKIVYAEIGDYIYSPLFVIGVISNKLVVLLFGENAIYISTSYLVKFDENE